MSTHQEYQESQELFKKNKNGKIQTWRAIVYSDDPDSAYMYTVYGQQNGKIQESVPVLIKGKNVGKKNETTPWEQALKEMQSKINKKIKTGFCFDLGDINNVLIKAQKYKTYNVSGHKINYPAFAQPKLDGHNALIHVSIINGEPNVHILSRESEPINFLDHIREDLLRSQWFRPGCIPDSPIPAESNTACDDPKYYDTDFYLNGELYRHGMPISTIQHLVSKKKSATDEELQEMTQIQFHVFDCFSMKDMNIGYRDRYGLMLQLNENSPGINSVILVNNHVVNSKDEADSLLEQYITENYEGIMIKNLDSVYKLDTRISDIVKLKPYSDREYEIVGFHSGKGKYENAIIFELITEDNRPFNSIMKGTIKQREEMLNKGDQLIGLFLKVKYIRLSPDGIPQEPVGLSLRSKNKE